jgi:hypothetical protein
LEESFEVAQFARNGGSVWSGISTTHITHVFVSFLSDITRKMHIEHWLSNRQFPKIDNDEGDFSVFVKFYNDQIIKAKIVIIQDKVEDLIPIAELLD